VLHLAAPGATFLLNSPFGPDEVWDHLPHSVPRQILDKGLKVFSWFGLMHSATIY